jgi:hypothetical protein
VCAGEMLTAGAGTGWGTDEAPARSGLVTTFPSQWHTRHNIPSVTTNLIALKDPVPRDGGTCFW